MFKHKNHRFLSLLNLRLFSALVLGLMVYSNLSLFTSAAEPPTVETRITIASDGEPTFDSVNYGPGPDGQYGSSSTDPLAADNTDPGNDDSANNGIVRNGDNVIYKIQVNLNGADATNLTSTITLTDGQTWQQLPDKCKPSSSSISPDKKTLICNLGDYHQGTVITLNAPAKVAGDTLNNTMLSASVSSTADGANTATDTSEETISTAAPRVNLVKKVLDRASGGEVIDPATSQPGYVIRYGIGLYAEKGSEPLNSDPITFTDTLTYASSVTPHHKIYDWGTDPACGQNPNKTGELPYGAVGITADANSTNSVTNSGTIACSQTGGQGTDLTITLTGADYSGQTVPYKFPDGNNISSAQNYLVAGYVDIWIPKDDLEQPEHENNGSYTLDTNNLFSTIDPTSISGTSNYGPGTEDSSDNDADAAITNVPSGGFWAWLSMDGDPGQGGKTGSVKAYAGGIVYPRIQIRAENSKDTSITGCTKIDTSEMTLTGNFLKSGSDEHFSRLVESYLTSPFVAPMIVGPDGIYGTSDDTLDPYESLSYADNSFNKSISYYYIEAGTNTFKWQDPDVVNASLEFSSTPISDYQTDTCDDSDGPWVSDPGSDSANFPNGWASVTRMRLKADFPPNPESYENAVDIFPEMQINPSLNPAAGGGYGNPAEPDAFTSLFYSVFIDQEDGYYGWRHGSIPTGTNNPFETEYSDRVELVSAQLRTNKTITNLESGNQVQPGDVVSYKLDTDLGGAPGGNTDVKLSDTLNSNLEYIVGSSVVTPGTAGILVNGQDPSTNPNIEPIVSGQTLTWHLTNVSVGAALPEITYDSSVSFLATSGTFDNIVIASEDNPNPIDTSSTEVERTSAASVYLSAPGDYDVIKTLTNIEDATIEMGEDLKFDLTYANTSASQDIHNLDFIEVFPFNGDSPRDPVSSYTDSSKLEFVSITGTLGGEQYLYTNADPATISDDPCHISNTNVGDPNPAVCPEGLVNDNGDTGQTATGTTNWYDCSGGFETGSCPIAQTDVTAVRMQIPEPSAGTPALPAGSPRQSFSLVLKPHDNLGGDIYTNNFGSRVSELDLKAISNDVTITVVDSSIGNRVWLDLNGDGVQDPGEPGIPGVTVNLYNADTLEYITSVQTDANGNYLFEGLHSGNYGVNLNSNPLDLTQTFDLDGLGSPNITEGSLAKGTDIDTWDFGYNGVGKLGGTVWTDSNENGVQDEGEAGMSNIPVTIIYYGGDGVLGTADDITFNLTTDSNGQYLLEGLPYGDYQVTVDPGNTYNNTYDLDGNKDSQTTLSLSAQNPENLTGDFSYVKKNTVEQIVTNVSEATSTAASNLANTGENAKIIAAAAGLLVVGGVAIMIIKRRK